MSEGSGRQEMERRLIEKSLEDESFRQRLIEDPKGTVEQELGARLPEQVRVEAMEETADTIYLVLPSTSMAGVELSEQQLESVAGGDSTSNPPWGAMTCGYACD
ncbi:MAG TPA: NHLP leader peptide family RiPP precursor [Rubrobacter sp.]|nr:NHLP leader peptide family RiPP precursor [Rubrobacter sp.]